MKFLKKITLESLKKNKKRTIVTIIGIILSVALITAVGTMYASGIGSLIKFEKKQFGDFHVAFYNVDKKDVETLKNNRKIEKLYFSKDIGYAKLEDSQNEYKPYAFVKAFNKDSFGNLSLRLVSGRMPKNENEIVIPTHLETNGRVKLNIGETIKLNIGSRVSEGYELNQNNPYTEDEEIINTTEKEYKIVGIIERPATNIESYEAPAYTFVTVSDKFDDNVDVYAKYTKNGTKDYCNVTANILGVDKVAFKKLYNNEINTEEEMAKVLKELDKAKYKINVNGYLISLEVNPLSEGALKGLGATVLIVCGIIVLTSVFCIKNSFDISITEKIKQYGMLRSVGATKKQIRKSVFYEGTVLGTIGIPLGIILGIIASIILVFVSNLYLDTALNLKLYFSISIYAIIFAVLLGIITVYLSAYNSARRASRISPINSIRSSESIKLNKRKLKSPKLIKKIFGVGGDISYKNLKRNKKKYRTTIISIIVSVTTFIALSSFMSLAFMSVEDEIKRTDANINLETNYGAAKSTLKLDDIDDYTIVTTYPASIKNPKYNKKYEELLNDDKNVQDFNPGYIILLSIGDSAYQKYIKKLNLDYNTTKNSGIIIDATKTKYVKNDNVYSLGGMYNYKKGDNLIAEYNTILNGEELVSHELELNVIGVTDVAPLGLEPDVYVTPYLLLSDSVMDDILMTNSEISNDDRWVSVYYKSTNPNKLQDNIEALLKNQEYDLTNKSENVKTMNDLFTLIGIFLYGFIIVISLIGITNIFNTITTNMELRKREFASLKSIGMTKKEFNRMIALESIFMGVKSLIYGIFFGSILSYVIYVKLGKDSGLSFRFPYMAVLISIVAVFLLITSIMKSSMKKINKQNTIETIRNENI